MTATCTICGRVITAERGPMLLNPGSDAAAAHAVAEISTFDLLAGRMSQHIETHDLQATEMAAVMFLAGKVYAMTWADCDRDDLRDAWRTGVLKMLNTTTVSPVTVDPLPDQADAEAAAGAAGGGAVVGSNAQNSVRNA